MGHGDDKIRDFEAAKDKIDLFRLKTAITFEQLQRNFSATTGGTGTVIDLTEFGGGTLTIEGVISNVLTAEMFSLPDCENPGDGLLVTNPVTGDEDADIGVPTTQMTLGGLNLNLSGDPLLT